MATHILVGLVLGFQANIWGEIFFFSATYGAIACVYMAILKRKVVEEYIQDAILAHGPESARRNFYLWLFSGAFGICLVVASVVFLIRR